jgi:hypothetical protein
MRPEFELRMMNRLARIPASVERAERRARVRPWRLYEERTIRIKESR